jgi:vacuolar-type H+-ATPase subunit I/STV1
VQFFRDFIDIVLLTLRDVLPIVFIIGFFQLAVLRQPVPRLKSVLIGLVHVLLGLCLFLIGLEKALFPIGEAMARQLSDPAFIVGLGVEYLSADWTEYGWIYLFAALIGFSTTIAEPSLIAVAIKASEVSAGTIDRWGLRIVVAVGVAFGITLGCFRIVSGTPLYLYIMAGYLIVIVQTVFAPKKIIALAYDSGGVTTSTVTVPIVTALGLGLAKTVPGRDPALDGFGLIAFASVFPIIAVMGYAQFIDWRVRRRLSKKS